MFISTTKGNKKKHLFNKKFIYLFIYPEKYRKYKIIRRSAKENAATSVKTLLNFTVKERKTQCTFDIA